MNSQQGFEWQFGGWAGLPPWLGWSLLLLTAAGGVGLAVWLYHSTLQKLSNRQRVIFILLRSGFFLALLVCLAGPSRVERTYDTGGDPRPLAVVVDHSASMTTTDSRGISRLTSAVRTWKQAEAAAIHSFSGLRYFSFSSDLSSVRDFEEAVDRPDPGPKTALYTSLQEALHSAPGGGYGGIVCLTDGLDTTDATSDQLVSRAVQSHTPLYFAAGENRQNAQETLIVRETSVPKQVLRKTQFAATALVEAYSIQPRDVPLSLTRQGSAFATTILHLRAGFNLIPWTVPVHSDEPAVMNLTWQLGNPAEKESLTDQVEVVGKKQVNVLFYQGTLDWGFRFINSALRQDPSFTLTGLFNPDLGLTQVVTANAQGALTALPDSADVLQPYQIVVLADVSAGQLSEAQQGALSEYVRNGGGLLFLVSDTQMAQTFSRTTLESMLPVYFEIPAESQQPDQAMADFQDQMHSIGGSNREDETTFAAEALPHAGLDPLKEFSLPAETTRKDIAQLFGHAADGSDTPAPRFASYAQAVSSKAGAEVLAVHPEDKTSAHAARPLLVTQRFGQGQVTALLTDALWRWKLSLPSTSHVPDIFWQQLFLALVGPSSAMHFTSQPYFVAMGEQSVFHLDGATGSNPPHVTVIAPAGTGLDVPVRAGSHPGEWIFQFSPNQPGKWHVQVHQASGSAEIETLLRVSNLAHGTELSGLPPDAEGLRKLAQATGGAMLNDGIPETWNGSTATRDKTLISEHVRPIWNTWAVLLLALSFYAVELIWRRQAKLL